MLAAIVSAGAAKVVLTGIRDIGGFYVRTPVIAFASADTLSGQFWGKVEGVLQVFGADFLGLPFQRTAIVALVAFSVWFLLIKGPAPSFSPAG